MPLRTVNGRPAPRSEGDDEIPVVQVRCFCGFIAGVVWRVERKHRGLPELLFLEAAIVAEPTARPVVTRMANQHLVPGQTVRADCVAHGPFHVPADALLKLARLSERPEGGKIRKFIRER
jgi:hypothetical protein